MSKITNDDRMLYSCTHYGNSGRQRANSSIGSFLPLFRDTAILHVITILLDNQQSPSNCVDDSLHLTLFATVDGFHRRPECCLDALVLPNDWDI